MIPVPLRGIFYFEKEKFYKFYGTVKISHPKFVNHYLNLSLPAEPKNSLMRNIGRTNIATVVGRLLILIFFGLISYGLTGSIAVKSTMGIVFAIIGLAAAIVFVYLLPKLYEPADEMENSQ